MLAFSLLVSLGLTPTAAQLKSTMRITSVWTTTTAEGSRVTVDADAPVNDYEAYKRGNRFYVRIPLADLPAARGSLLGRGFDDVQIERYGDGIILSFRLQPGTTARVSQTGNRLDVIFSIPGRSQRAGTAAASNGAAANCTRPRRTEDTAGPTPSSSPTASGKSRGVAKRDSSRYSCATVATSRGGHKSTPSKGKATRGSKGDSLAAKLTPRSPTAAAPKSNGNASTPSAMPPVSTTAAAQSSSTPTQSATAAVSSARPVSGASPGASESVSSSPVVSAYSPPTSSLTPAAQQTSSVTSQTPSTTASSDQGADWASREHYYKLWVTLNWLPLLIGGLVVLCLLVLLLSSLRAKRRRGVTARAAAEPAAQPVASAVPVKTTAGVAQRASAPAEPVRATSVWVPLSRTQAAGLAQNSSDASLAREDLHGGGQEREVFEL